MLFSILVIYWNFQSKEDKNQTKTEQKIIIVPTRLTKSIVLSKTSLKTYLALGILYSGSSEINDVVLFLKINFLRNKLLIKIITIAKKYKLVVTKPVLLGKNHPTNNAIIGSFALHGTNGESITVITLSSEFSIVLVEEIAGTEQPVPIIKGTSDFPLSPNFWKILSNIRAILDIYPVDSKMLINKNITTSSGKNVKTDPTPEMTPFETKLTAHFEAPNFVNASFAKFENFEIKPPK